MDLITLDIVKERLIDNNFELLPSQKRICLPILNRIYLKMKSNLYFKPIQISKGIIIEGHHRYLASILSNKNIEILNLDLNNLPDSYTWKNLQIDEKDWDSPEFQERINLKDAYINNLSLKEVLKIINNV